MAKNEAANGSPKKLYEIEARLDELAKDFSGMTMQFAHTMGELDRRHQALCKDFTGSCDAQSELNHRVIAFMDDFDEEYVEARHDQKLADATTIVARMAEAIYDRRAEYKGWTTPWSNLNGKRKSDFMELGWAAYGAEHDEQ